MGAGWGVADSLLQFRVPDLGFLEGGNARVGIFPEPEEIFVGLVTADTNGRRSIPEACARPASTVGFNPFLKRKSRLFIRSSSGFSPVFPQLVEQQATASAIWGGEEGQPCRPVCGIHFAPWLLSRWFVWIPTLFGGSGAARADYTLSAFDKTLNRGGIARFAKYAKGCSTLSSPPGF